MNRILTIALILASLVLATPQSWAIKTTTLQKRLIRSAESFQNVTLSEMGAIPAELVKSAQGIIIFRQYEAGFVFGGKGGAGVALAKDRNGRWSAPAFLKSGEGSFGFQIGAQRLDVVYLFMNKDAMRLFETGRFRIGVDAAAVAGPVGGNLEGKVGAPILVYSNNAGLYAGATIEGGVLIPDSVANETYYGVAGISVPEILYSRNARVTPEARSLIAVIDNYRNMDEGEYYERSTPSYRQDEQPQQKRRGFYEPQRPQGYYAPNSGPGRY